MTFNLVPSVKLMMISSAPNFPSLTGSGALYSKDFFQLCRKRLAPGGVMCQFAPIWAMLPEDAHTIVGSFVDVFPYGRVFSTGLSLVMLGREEPFPPVDLQELSAARVGGAVEYLETGHMAMVSAPEQVAKLLNNLV